jgi:hypothetical protein
MALAAPIPTTGPANLAQSHLFFCFFLWGDHPPLHGLSGARIEATGVASGSDVLGVTRLSTRREPLEDALAAGRRPFEAAVGLVGESAALLTRRSRAAAVRSGCRGPLGQPSHPKVGWEGRGGPR